MLRRALQVASAMRIPQENMPSVLESLHTAWKSTEFPCVVLEVISCYNQLVLSWNHWPSNKSEMMRFLCPLMNAMANWKDNSRIQTAGCDAVLIVSGRVHQPVDMVQYDCLRAARSAALFFPGDQHIQTTVREIVKTLVSRGLENHLLAPFSGVGGLEVASYDSDS